MGVQNLWVLLAPVGRQIEIESLEGKVLAVDASIWLTQFVKAMRDDEGNMIRNAHLVGTFHRVAKLLYYGVRPVFVFDGDTPEIKKRTTARRRKRQENQAANLRQTAQRILINRLKLHREEMKKNGGVAPAIDPSFVIPDATPVVNKAAPKTEDAIIEILEDEDDVEMDTADESSSLVVASGTTVHEDETGDDDGSIKSEEELSLDDIDLDTSHLSKIDLHAVFSLPPHLQKSMVEKIQRDRRQEVRDQFIPLAGQPEAYSHVQISSFLATVKLNRRIEAARRQKTQEELEAEKKSAEPGGSSGSSEHLLGQGKRIASNSSKFFIYEKASDDKAPATQLINRQVPRAAGDVITVSDDDDSGSERELLSDIDKTADLESSAAGVETYGLSLDDRFRPNKRRRQMPKGADPGKMSLSEFSAKDFVEQSERRVQSDQERPELDMSKALSSWIARHHIQAKQEPELAIEKARRERLGLAGNNRSEQVSKTTLNKSPVFLNKERALDDFSSQANASLKSPSRSSRVAEVKATIPALSANTESKNDPILVTKPSDINTSSGDSKVIEADGGDDDDDDDDIEWEDVREPVAEPKDNDGVSTMPLLEEKSIIQSAPSKQDIINTAISKSPVLTESESDIDEDQEEVGDDMMLTLKSEIEDAKAEEDLNLLKEEALHSAMVTASNLTQWAAGAVRRALAAHTQNHKNSPIVNRTTQSWTPTRNPPARQAINQVIEIDGDEDEMKPIATAKAVDLTEEEQKEEKTPIPDGKDAEWTADSTVSDDQLQMALAESLREESAATSSDKVRYLQYADKDSPSGTPVPAHKIEGDSGEKETLQSLEREQRELKKMRNRQQRDVEGVNDEMVQDVMELLRLFGVPYLVCPMEAEAQCATLEMLGLVDGIITDDSDIFPFGGTKVYKNIFHNQKFVEAFFAQDIQKELGFSREDIIALALLLGSDYTDGVRGIGIVNATEVVNAFPGIDGLREFKQWVHAFDLTEEASRAAAKKKKSDEELERMAPRERFEHTHASVRRKWELGEAFPNSHVVQAYMSPQVDKSEERFSWNLPDLAGLRTFCTQTFGWDQGKTDGVLLPLMERATAAAATRNGRPVQTRIDHFFRSYDDQVKFAKIKSKRLRSAVEGRTQTSLDDGQIDASKDIVVIEESGEDDQEKPDAAPVTSKFFTKKKTSMSAVAGGKNTTSKRKSSRK